MKFDLFENLIKPVEFKPLSEPEPQPLPETEPPPFVPTDDAKKVNAQFVGANYRLQLEKKLPTEKPTPYGALEEINKLPKPDLNDKAAVKAYKERRAEIANNAIKNSEPPTFQKFLDYGMNGATASMEYEQSLITYNLQISQLKVVTADAKNYPDKILTPGEAIIEINNLPRPDRNDPQSILEYNNKRAAIADSALLYATPPKREDYLNSGLNGATADMEYRQALSYYNAYVTQLKEYSGAGGTTILPKITDAEANKAADDYIKAHNGVKNEDDAYAVGKDVAELAKTDPESAALVMKKVQDKLNNTDYGDNVASGFVDNSSVEDLRKIAQTFEGELMLEDLQDRLLSGTVYDSEIAQATKIGEAITPGADQAASDAAERLSDYIEDLGLGTLDELNDKIASEIKDLKEKYGDEAAAQMMADLYKKNPEDLFTSLRLADHMSDSDKQAIGKALGDSYGYLSQEERAEFAELVALTTVGDSFTTNVNAGESTTLAELLAHSSNTEMKTDIVKAMMDLAGTIEAGPLGDNGGVDVQALFKSAAMIADTAPPAERAAMLKNIIETLPKINLPSLIKDNETKDLLSKLFMNSGPEFLRLIAPDGAISSPGVRDGLVKFAELTLFSEGKNSLRTDLMAYMVKLTKDVGDAAVQPPISESEYERTHNGWAQVDHVEIMGTLMAITWKAADNQKEAIKADQQQQKETVQMFTGLAFSFVPGAGKVLGELGGEGAEFLEQAAGKIRDFAWDKAQGAAQSGVEDQINNLLSDDSLENIDTMISSLRGTVLSLSASLPNGEDGELDLRDKFQAAFAYYQLI